MTTINLDESYDLELDETSAINKQPSNINSIKTSSISMFKKSIYYGKIWKYKI